MKITHTKYDISCGLIIVNNEAYRYIIEKKPAQIPMYGLRPLNGTTEYYKEAWIYFVNNIINENTTINFITLD